MWFCGMFACKADVNVAGLDNAEPLNFKFMGGMVIRRWKKEVKTSKQRSLLDLLQFYELARSQYVSRGIAEDR